MHAASQKKLPVSRSFADIREILTIEQIASLRMLYVLGYQNRNGYNPEWEIAALEDNEKAVPTEGPYIYHRLTKCVNCHHYVMVIPDWRSPFWKMFKKPFCSLSCFLHSAP